MRAQTIRSKIKETALRSFAEDEEVASSFLCTRNGERPVGNAAGSLHSRLQQWRRVVFTDDSCICLVRVNRSSNQNAFSYTIPILSLFTAAMSSPWIARRNWWSWNTTWQRKPTGYCLSSTLSLSQTPRLENSKTASSKMTILHHTEQLLFVSWKNNSTSGLYAGHQDPLILTPLSTPGISWKGKNISS